MNGREVKPPELGITDARVFIDRAMPAYPSELPEHIRVIREEDAKRIDSLRGIVSLEIETPNI